MQFLAIEKKNNSIIHGLNEDEENQLNSILNHK